MNRASRRRREDAGLVSKHTRFGPIKDKNGDFLVWHTTKPNPSSKKTKRREKNKRDRQARKDNR